MFQLEWKKQANNDLINIVMHIAEDSQLAANHLADLILEKVAQLRERPELYRAGRKRGTREMVVHPHYIVIYRVRKATVEILRVKHTAQRWPTKG
ncbi:type II toxin-antitoxin system RelE/ParE family toxin [Massilia sp. CCM 9210]|uniref:type II toxin-antitoxin system RelE/ParE family toxin n=1 Tax=Massilia scottii TaxID=3057166 RepID=UPI002796A2C8|nr:type II toxin-antitoxin system RelE/ParE family toxin [Massilia sp. CCM 9210]MDQ1812134.1 type II toxin-antitoxin system RelE/ParE family toxin [Massilia sp. CCM 9210]